MNEIQKLVVEKFMLELKKKYGKFIPVSEIQVGSLIEVKKIGLRYNGLDGKLGYNEENNPSEKPFLMHYQKSVHDGTIFVDILNKTLIETEEGFSSWGSYNKYGILVDKIEPLSNYTQNTTISSFSIEQLAELNVEINNKRVKGK